MVFTIPSGSNNQGYSSTYPPRIEHAGMVKKVEIMIEKETKVNQGKSLTRKGRKRSEEDKRNNSAEEI